MEVTEDIIEKTCCQAQSNIDFDIRNLDLTEGTECRFLGPFLYHLYGIFKRQSIRSIIRKLVLKFERGDMYSVTIRRIFSKYHGIDVGMYSCKGMFIPGNFKQGTRIGRHCSIYVTACAFNANHPMNTKSTHALFYNPLLGHTESDSLTRTRLTIGSDVFIGHNAIILPTVASIGHGAIIGAGAVVNKDVPPYSVVVGNPARIVRYRFTQPTIDSLLAERWWHEPFDKIKEKFQEFQKPLEGEEIIR